MRHAEYGNLCSAMDEGKERHVKHIVTHQVGTVVACNLKDYEFEVEVGGERKTWIAENCLDAD